jgi:DNA-directed RNA polymerase specialized sigma24 family protein
MFCVMYYGDVKRVALEDALLWRAKQHDEQALAAIYDTYAPRINAYTYRRVGDAMLVENLVGDVFARAECHSVRQAWRTSFQGWLYRIAPRRRYRRYAGVSNPFPLRRSSRSWPFDER